MAEGPSSVDRDALSATDIDNLLKAEEFPGAEADPFTRPYGPTSECFSNNDVARMFRLGAVKRDVDHLRSCPDCARRIEVFSAMTGPRPSEAPARSRVRRWIEGMRAPQPARAVGQMLMHVPTTYIVDASGNVMTAQVQLVAHGNVISPEVKVRIVGGIDADGATWKFEDQAFPILEVQNVKASREVRRALEHHRRIITQVVVELGEPSKQPVMTAMADVEFVRAH